MVMDKGGAKRSISMWRMEESFQKARFRGRKGVKRKKPHKRRGG